MTKSATVVGAGIAGLTSAMALAEGGFRVTALEQTHRPSSEIGLAITSNGLEALAEIGMREAAESVGVRTRMGSILTQNGTPLMQETETDAGDIVTVAEETLLSILSERAEELGVSIHRDVIVRTDEDIPDSDFVVGADGLRSAVRRWVAPRVRPDYSGAACWYGITESRDDTPSAVTSWVGRGTEAGILPINGNRAYWYISAMARQRAGSGFGDTEPVTEATRLAAQFDGPLAEHVARTEAAVRRPLFYLPTGLTSFTSNRTGTPTVLVGDAAHATVPSLVQGANQAFEDAATLRVLLDNELDFEALLGRYDGERVRRAQALQRRSLCAMGWMQAPGPITGAVRNAVLKLTPTLAAEVVIGWHGRWVSPNAPR